MVPPFQNQRSPSEIVPKGFSSIAPLRLGRERNQFLPRVRVLRKRLFCGYGAMRLRGFSFCFFLNTIRRAKAKVSRAQCGFAQRYATRVQSGGVILYIPFFLKVSSFQAKRTARIRIMVEALLECQFYTPLQLRIELRSFSGTASIRGLQLYYMLLFRKQQAVRPLPFWKYFMGVSPHDPLYQFMRLLNV
jgi:hypothetical protein